MTLFADPVAERLNAALKQYAPMLSHAPAPGERRGYHGRWIPGDDWRQGQRTWEARGEQAWDAHLRADAAAGVEHARAVMAYAHAHNIGTRDLDGTLLPDAPAAEAAMQRESAGGHGEGGAAASLHHTFDHGRQHGGFMSALERHVRGSAVTHGEGAWRLPAGKSKSEGLWVLIRRMP